MTNYDYILGVDPSGSFKEGKGTTGWSLFNIKANKFIMQGTVCAKDYHSMEEYWSAVVSKVKEIAMRKKRADNTMVVIEDYLLYENKAKSQINSRMETPKLIGVLQHYCYCRGIPYWMQTASLVKPRWTDEILEHKGYLVKKGTRWDVSEHIRDSMRHAIHYATFCNERR